MNGLLRKLFWVMVFMVIPVLLYGCDQGQFRPFRKAPLPPSDQISKEELRHALDNYEEFFIHTVKYVSNELDELSPKARTHKNTLNLRSHSIGACRTMLEQEEPLVAFIDSWVLSVRLTEYFETGEGSDLFVPHQEIVIDATKKIQSHIESIGMDFLDEKTFITTRENVYTFARDHPIKENFAESVIFATKPQEGQPNIFDDAINISLVPFKAVEGVAQGVVGTHKLSDSANHFSDVVEGWPESARWQLLLLLYDMQKMDMVKSVLADMSEFSNSSSRFADSAEKLPEQLRQQLSILIEEIDTKQTGLQNTIGELHTLVAKVNDLTQQANWRIAQLIILVFVLALVYRILVVRFVNKPKSG